jgi:hypothetical protein
MRDVAEPPFLQPSPVLLDALSAEQRGAVNHVVLDVSSSCLTDSKRVLCPPPILIATPLS